MSVDEPSTDGGGSRLYQAGLVFYLLVAIAAVVWIGSGPGLSLDLIIDPDFWWLDVLLGVSSGGLLIGMWHFARNYFASMLDLEQYLTDLLAPLQRDEIIALALVSGFSEELLFRGAMQPAWGFVAATLIFALLHTGPRQYLATWTSFAALAGLVFGALTHVRGTILAAVIGHILVNGVNLLLIRTRTTTADPSSETGAE